MTNKKPNQKPMTKALNVFKAGFYSEDSTVSRLCAEFFMHLMLGVTSLGGDIVGETWDWLAKPSGETDQE